MASYLIGIDIGTGSSKALAVNYEGKVLFSSQVHYPTISPSHGFVEQDPEIVWQAFVSCINRIVKQANSNPDGVILSSAMHSLMAVNQNGAPLHNMIIWADNRSSALAKALHQSNKGKLIYEETGTPIHAMSPLCKLIWLRENDPELFQKAFKFISIKEYIWFRLFGAYECDHSIASATGLMNIDSCEWSRNALDIAGISSKQLSSLVSTSYKRNDARKDVCEQLGVSTNTPFVAGASDGCLANLGSFATTNGIAALTIGTSGAVRVASNAPVHNFKAMTFNYRLDEKTFITGGPTNNGGAVLRWYAQNFLQKTLDSAEDYAKLLEALPLTEPGADGLVFLPYLFGERAPIWDSDASGVFFGIRNNHNQAHFTRAVVEGISMALYDITNNMMESGLNVSQINVSGGFVKSTSWLQVLSNIFNKKICLINSDDASALGAAYLGLKSIGKISDYSLLQPETVTEILPQSQYVNLYNKHFETYRSLYAGLSGIMTKTSNHK